MRLGCANRCSWVFYIPDSDLRTRSPDFVLTMVQRLSVCWYAWREFVYDVCKCEAWCKSGKVGRGWLSICVTACKQNLFRSVSDGDKADTFGLVL